jgi:outer membrane protein assembly factor BamA
MDAGSSSRYAHKLNFLKLWPAKRVSQTAPMSVYPYKMGTFPSSPRSCQTVAAIRASKLTWSWLGSAICFGGTRILISEKRKRLDVTPLLLLICVLSMNGMGAWAQDAKQASSQTPSDARIDSQFLASYEGQTVTAINVAGRPELNTAQFSPLFVQHVGEPFSQDKVEKTLEALKAGGKFQDVELRVEPQANGVRILFILDPAVYFGIFEFPGAERLSYTRLVQVSNFTAQSPYSAEDVEQDRQSLLTFLRQQGYFQADVQTETRVDEPAALANILFHVTLKKRA